MFIDQPIADDVMGGQDEHMTVLAMVRHQREANERSICTKSKGVEASLAMTSARRVSERLRLAARGDGEG